MDMQNVAKLDIPEGEVRTIHDKDGNLIWGKVSYGVRYEGDTAQNGTPTPSAPIAVQTVTGEQTISINGAAHTVNLGSIELCKIGDYQDYIYKSGNKWHKHKAIDKVVLNGSEGWYKQNYGGNTYSLLSGTIENLPNEDTIVLTKSDYFQSTSWNGRTQNIANSLYPRLAETYGSVEIRNTSWPTADDFKTWLTNNRPALYYALAAPTDTEITNAALVAQLENVEQWLTRYGYNATVSGNLPIIIDRTAL